MRILQVHNPYQFHGGEDVVAKDELALLQQRGHEVQSYQRHNEEIRRWSVARKALLFLSTAWDRQSYREIRQQIRIFRPDVVHVHNFLPLVSPAVFFACAAEKTPAVLTLHNYRLLCPGALLLRDGKICEACVGTLPWRAVLYGCYRHSRVQSAAVSRMLTLHRLLGTWQHRVAAYVALTEFSRGKFIAGGLPAEKIHVRPNFLLHDPGPGAGERRGALFVGRLSPEKGIEPLLKAWRMLPEVPLTLAGDGPLLPWTRSFIRKHRMPHVNCLGQATLPVILEKMKQSLFLVMPSIWYETFGRTIIEAYATATPVLASRLGAMEELIQPGKTGLLFQPDNSDDLAAKVREALGQRDQLSEWGAAARDAFEKKYSAETAHTSAIKIYESVIHFNAERP